MEDEQRRTLLEDAFRDTYERSPTVWVQAPGRVDLMGSHTDYNEGFVLVQAIGRNTWIAARPRDDALVRIKSLNMAGRASFEAGKFSTASDTPWVDYVSGVAAVLGDSGYDLRGLDGVIHSTVPVGSGLSSSAALEVSTCLAFDVINGLGLAPLDMARICQRAENVYVGMECGILDQYASIMGEAGSAILLDCRSQTSDARPIAEGISLVVCDTKASRELTGSAYRERRAQCEEGVRLLAEYLPPITALRDVSAGDMSRYRERLPQPIRRRCDYIVDENQRVFDIAAALETGDERGIERLAMASFQGARDQYEIVSAEMEAMMHAMMSAPGVIGARQAGAGFGGCMVAFVRAAHVSDFAEKVKGEYASATGLVPDVFAVEAAAGASVMDA